MARPEFVPGRPREAKSALLLYPPSVNVIFSRYRTIAHSLMCYNIYIRGNMNVSLSGPARTCCIYIVAEMHVKGLLGAGLF